MVSISTNMARLSKDIAEKVGTNWETQKDQVRLCGVYLERQCVLSKNLVRYSRSLFCHCTERPPLIDVDTVRHDLQKLYDEGYRSLAIVLAHSYTFPDHERLIGNLAREVGFSHVSESAQLLPMIKMVPRGVSATADAYLTPILREYLDGFFNGFDEKLRDGTVRSPRVEFMGSDGGLVDVANFSGLKSILSGPAGGVVGYALTSWDAEKKVPIIGFVYHISLFNPF